MKFWNSVKIYTTFLGVSRKNLRWDIKQTNWFLNIFSTVWQSEVPFSIFFFFSRRFIEIAVTLRMFISIISKLPRFSAVLSVLLWDRTYLRLGDVCMEMDVCRRMDSTFFHSSSEKNWLSGSHWRLQERTSMDTNTFSFFVSKITYIKQLYMQIAWKFIIIMKS